MHVGGSQTSKEGVALPPAVAVVHLVAARLAVAGRAEHAREVHAPADHVAVEHVGGAGPEDHVGVEGQVERLPLRLLGQLAPPARRLFGRLLQLEGGRGRSGRQATAARRSQSHGALNTSTVRVSFCITTR